MALSGSAQLQRHTVPRSSRETIPFSLIALVTQSLEVLRGIRAATGDRVNMVDLKLDIGRFSPAARAPVVVTFENGPSHRQWNRPSASFAGRWSAEQFLF
jgi:hypothetical protein